MMANEEEILLIINQTNMKLMKYEILYGRPEA